MENSNLNPDEKRALLKDYNHRINNDLQALLAFIKLQRRFGIDNEEILNSTSVSIASISAIQNLMYETDEDENFISTGKFFEYFIKILDEQYSNSNIKFSGEVENDFNMHPKKVFHLMFLVTEMVNLSINVSFKDDSEHEISFSLEKNGEECLLIYSDNGEGIKETISESSIQTVLVEQSIKQINGTLESSNDNSTVHIKFNYN